MQSGDSAQRRQDGKRFGLGDGCGSERQVVERLRFRRSSGRQQGRQLQTGCAMRRKTGCAMRRKTGCAMRQTTGCAMRRTAIEPRRRASISRRTETQRPHRRLNVPNDDIRGDALNRGAITVANGLV